MVYYKISELPANMQQYIREQVGKSGNPYIPSIYKGYNYIYGGIAILVLIFLMIGNTRWTFNDMSAWIALAAWLVVLYSVFKIWQNRQYKQEGITLTPDYIIWMHRGNAAILPMSEIRKTDTIQRRSTRVVNHAARTTIYDILQVVTNDGGKHALYEEKTSNQPRYTPKYRDFIEKNIREARDLPPHLSQGQKPVRINSSAQLLSVLAIAGITLLAGYFYIQTTTKSRQDDKLSSIKSSGNMDVIRKELDVYGNPQEKELRKEAEAILNRHITLLNQEPDKEKAVLLQTILKDELKQDDYSIRSTRGMEDDYQDSTLHMINNLFATAFPENPIQFAKKDLKKGDLFLEYNMAEHRDPKTYTSLHNGLYKGRFILGTFGNSLKESDTLLSIFLPACTRQQMEMAIREKLIPN